MKRIRPILEAIEYKKGGFNENLLALLERLIPIGFF